MGCNGFSHGQPIVIDEIDPIGGIRIDWVIFQRYRLFTVMNVSHKLGRICNFRVEGIDSNSTAASQYLTRAGRTPDIRCIG